MSLEEAIYGEVLRRLNLDPDDIDLDISNDIFERCEELEGYEE